MFKTKLLAGLVILLSLILPLISHAQPLLNGKKINFRFSLKSDAKTSAGVYFKDGTLIRTLWSGTAYNAGPQMAQWDGLDDEGKVAPVDSAYEIKVLNSNVKYEWEGARIGNTSDALTGSSKLRFFEPVRDMVVLGNTIYMAGGYNEGWPAQFKVTVDNPNAKKWIGRMKSTDQASDYVTTDGKIVYWGGYDPLEKPATAETFVMATSVINDAYVSFAKGVPASMEWGGVYASAISYMRGPLSMISGLAVQQKGRFLFVARSAMDELYVLDKTSGDLVTKLKFNGVKGCKIDSEDNLWFIYNGGIEKFIVNVDGTLQSSGLVIKMAHAATISISPDNNTLLVADMDTQQVRSFNAKTGVTGWVLGQPGGYLKNATVTDDKFYWKDVRDEKLTFLTYLPDASFYVGDVGNLRAQLYSAGGVFKSSIMFLQNVYNTSVDKQDPTRVFADFLEFKVDYTIALGARNGSWKLVNNWGGNFGAEYDQFNKILNITALKNGRTYGKVRSQDKFFVVELVKGGVIRKTKIEFGQRIWMNEDGTKIYNPGTAFGFPCDLLQYELLGFDNDNDPIWSNSSKILARTPNVTGTDPVPWEGFRGDVLTKSGNVIYFDYTRADQGHSYGYHLGAVKKGTNKWLWRTAKSTDITYNGPFPEDGSFDNGNGVVAHGAGGPALISGDNIFWGYHGEFWKQSQTNKWNHVDGNTGLFVDQFGVLTTDHPNEEAFAGGAGNVMNGTVVEINGITYLYHNDESVHNAVHRWKITGLNTIEVQVATITTDELIEDGIDLLSGLPRSGDLLNENGWNPGNNTYEWAENIWHVTTGAKTYDPFKSPDVNMVFSQKTGTRIVSRDLGDNTNLSSWSLIGKMNFEKSAPTQAQFKGVAFVEVLDKKGYIISRFDLRQDVRSGQNIVGNDQILFHGTDDEVDKYKNYSQPIEISAKNGELTFKYATFSATTTNLLQPEANWKEPKQLRFFFATYNPADNQLKFFNVSEMKFRKTMVQTAGAGYFQSLASGDWEKISSWQSSADGVNWLNATKVPDSAASGIMILANHKMIVNSDIFVDQLTVSNNAELQIAFNGAINVTNAAGNDVVVNPLGKLIIKSNERGTGRIGKSTGNIVGNVTVERYISAKTGYRLLAPAVNTKTTINANWQEGVNNASTSQSINPNPGYGTHITGSVNGSNGFDATATGNGSLFTLSSGSIPASWVLGQNTNEDTLSAKKGYLLFFRGNRSHDLNQKNMPATSTILRATGTVLTGKVVYDTLQGNGVNNLLANPYPSPISWVTMHAANNNAVENYFSVWDPNIGTRGGYVTVDASGTKSVLASAVNSEIQSGQAFSVKTKANTNRPSFIINEDDKLTTFNLSGFRTGNGPDAKLYTSLYLGANASARNLADGVLSRFNNNYLLGVDGDDAEDVSNFNENISLQRNGSLLSIESRPLTTTKDTLFINMSNMQQLKYEWQFDAADFDLSMAVGAFLNDRYRGIEVPVNLAGVTVVPFEVTNDPASASANRFYVVFEQLRALPVTLLSLKAIKNNGAVTVDWTTAGEVNINRFEIERSTDGSQFTKIGEVKTTGLAGTTNAYTFLDRQPLAGYNYYKLKMIDEDGSFKFSQVVRVIFDERQKFATVYPNPVKGNSTSVSIPGLLAGNYNIQLTNIAGQIIQSLKVNHVGGLFNKIISTSGLPAGKYQLQIIGNGIPITIPVIRL